MGIYFLINIILGLNYFLLIIFVFIMAIIFTVQILINTHLISMTQPNIVY